MILPFLIYFSFATLAERVLQILNNKDSFLICNQLSGTNHSPRKQIERNKTEDHHFVPENLKVEHFERLVYKFRLNQHTHTILWASDTPHATWGFTIFGKDNFASASLCSRLGWSKLLTCILKSKCNQNANKAL